MLNLIVVLLMFVAIGAVIAIWTRDLLSAVIAIGVVGFTRTVLFVLLRAPDVAITQVVVEVLLLIILIRSNVKREIHTTEAWRTLPGMALAAAFLVVFVVIGVVAIRENIRPYGIPVQGPVAASADETVADAPSITYLKNTDKENADGVAQNKNCVTAILVRYRLFDLLGLSAAFFAAVIGGMALLRQHGRTKREPEETESA